ncbi:MAG TPA: hypothetical protein DIW80_15925, partial [Gordonia polyisoprenivorans]|nr:hypothetical protein [Gordonia polyisoprenivorans]
GGKRFRPLLVLLAAETGTHPEAEEVLTAALDTLAEMIIRAPMPVTRPAAQTRAMNLVRRARRRVLALRRSIGG